MDATGVTPLSRRSFFALASGLLVPMPEEPRRAYSFAGGWRTEKLSVTYDGLVAEASDCLRDYMRDRLTGDREATARAIERALASDMGAFVMPPGFDVRVTSTRDQLLKDQILNVTVSWIPISPVVWVSPEEFACLA